MKKTILFLLVIAGFAVSGFGQVPLTGIKTIPGDFPKIEMAIYALNTYGVGAGGVIFDVAAGTKDTLSSSTAGHFETFATGSAANPILFRKAGIGDNPQIIAGIGNQANRDGIIMFNGASYITFDGIDLQENSLNTSQVPKMEYGYVLAKSIIQGSSHITIKNCNIVLGDWGTCIGGVTWRYFDGVTVNPSTILGTNSFNSFYNNSFSHCANGIYLIGHNAPTPYTLYDQDNSIGGDSGGGKSGELGNTVTLWSGRAVSATYQNNITVAGNIIFGDNILGNQVYGIFLDQGFNSSYLVHDNILSANITAGSGGFYGIYVQMGASGTSNTTTFYNNSVTNCLITGTGLSGGLNMMFAKGGYTTNIYNNQVIGNTFGSLASESLGMLYHMTFGSDQAVSGGTCNVFNNTCTNNLRRVNSPPSGTQGITFLLSLSATRGTVNCYNNIFDQNSSLTMDQSQCVAINATNSIIKFYNNVIANFEARGLIYGMNLLGASDKYIYNNKISNIKTVAGDKYVYGVLSQGTSSNSHYLYNNLISGLKAPNAKNTTVLGVYGYSGKLGLYNNTIFLDATTDTVTTNIGTAAVYGSADATLRLDLRNNIIVNNSTHLGTGVTAALRFAATAPPFTSGNYLELSNNNDLYAGTPSPGNYIFYQSATIKDSTLAAFKLRVWPRESASVSEMPPFENILTAPYDLHLKANIPTQCESGAGVISDPFSINIDYDSLPRFPNTGFPDNPLSPATAPDMGADEFGGLKIDITPPAITLTPLINTIEITERTLTTTITDGTGVPASGSGLPVLYWKKSISGTWNGVQAVYTSPNTYNFTFGGGVAVGDSVYYYVVAQDLVSPAPNVGSSPFAGSGGYSVNPPACSVPPVDSVLFVYKIVAPVCGTYQVGTGQTYGTISEAFSDFISRPVTCPVTLLLTDATYPTQTYPIIVPQLNGISSVNTLTIKPAPGVSPVFSGSSATGIFNFNGAKYIIIDGSNSGNGDKSLTFINAAATANSYAVGFVNAGTNKSTDCIIRNCVIKASSQVTTNTYGIFMSPAVGGYTNIIIDNNTICSARIGISMSGTSADLANDIQITNNIIGSALDAEAIQFQGIWTNYANNTLIRGNDIMGAYAGNTNTSMDGIYLGTGTTATKIRQNEIHNFKAPNGSINTVDAINLFSGSATTLTEITNNLIYGIIGKNGCVGINIASGGNVLIAHNTVSLTDSSFYDGASSTRYSACLRIASGVTLLDVRNNIFQNIQQCIEPLNTSPLTYAVYSSSAATAFTFIDNNDYFVNEAYPLEGLSGRIGYLGSQRITLANWQSATLKDASSQSVNPAFASATNLHTAVPAINNAGVALPSVTTDHDGVVRTNPPDLGAYEFILPIAVINTLDTTAVGMTLVTLNGNINAAGEVVNVSFEYGTTASYGSVAAATPSTIRSVAVTVFSANLTGLLPGTQYHYRAKGISTTSAETVYGNDMTFTTISDIPVNASVQNVTMVNGNDTCFNATNTITVAGNGTTFVVENGGSATMIAGEKILYLPGTLVLEGGYMLGFITLTNEYCGIQDAPIMANAIAEPALSDGGELGLRIYPNPTTGSFTIEIPGNTTSETSFEIYNLNGEKVLKTSAMGVNKQVVSLDRQPTGLYFIRLVTDGKSVTGKIFKN